MNLCLQEPVERKLGYTICTTTTRKSRPHLKRKWDYAYDVPLLSSLHQIMSDSLILNEVGPCSDWSLNRYSLIKADP